MTSGLNEKFNHVALDIPLKDGWKIKGAACLRGSARPRILVRFEKPGEPTYLSRLDLGKAWMVQGQGGFIDPVPVSPEPRQVLDIVQLFPKKPKITP